MGETHCGWLGGWVSWLAVGRLLSLVSWWSVNPPTRATPLGRPGRRGWRRAFRPQGRPDDTNPTQTPTQPTTHRPSQAISQPMSGWLAGQAKPGRPTNLRRGKREVSPRLGITPMLTHGFRGPPGSPDQGLAQRARPGPPTLRPPGSANAFLTTRGSKPRGRKETNEPTPGCWLDVGRVNPLTHPTNAAQPEPTLEIMPMSLGGARGRATGGCRDAQSEPHHCRSAPALTR